MSEAANKDQPAVTRLSADWDGTATKGQPTLVLLHGFMGHGGGWSPIRDGLRAVGPTLAVDLIGHGMSPVPKEESAYSMESCLDQLEALLERLGIVQPWVVGYSMGGRVALQLAVHRPHLVAGLVLESTTPGLKTEEEREARRAADDELAKSLETEGAEKFVDQWLDGPLFAGMKRLPEDQYAFQRTVRLSHWPEGLAHALRQLGTGSMSPVWDQLPNIQVPTLLMAGGEDKKFTEIAQEMAKAIPLAQLTIVPNVGHTIHAENPGVYIDTINRFFDEQKAPPEQA